MQVNSRFIENYQKGRDLAPGPSITAGVGNRGLGIEYRGDEDKYDWRPKYSLNIPIAPGQKYRAAIGQEYKKPNDLSGGAELSYTEGQGLRSRLNVGYNFQVGDDKLKAGKANLSINPYLQGQPNLEIFRRNILGKEDALDDEDNLDDYGKKQGYLSGGLKLGVNYKPTKQPFYLYGNAGVDISTKGIQRDIRYEDRKTIVGDSRHGSLSDPNIKLSGEAGIRYNIGEKAERGRRKRLFEKGGILLYKK
jgi:hypothetical protein